MDKRSNGQPPRRPGAARRTANQGRRRRAGGAPADALPPSVEDNAPAIVESPVELPPGTATSFTSFGVSAEVVDALALRNIDQTFAIQALVLADALAGRDVLAKSRTGSGKTLAFAIPIVERVNRNHGPSALILVPTRELTSQVAEEFRTIADVKKLRVATVYGGVKLKEQAQRASKSDIVIATPGRLLDLHRRRLLHLDKVRICVLDEADRMLDMGFLPDVSDILSLLPQKRQTMLFSATLDGEIAFLAARFTHEPVRHEVVDARPVVETATHRFIPVDSHQAKTPTLIRELAGDRGLTLIFVKTKRTADYLATQLKNAGFGAHALHGDMTQPARERALARFADGKADVLVATDVAARGLDLDNITHVVNYDPPSDDKAYVHRIGRTARAGRAGTGITLVTPDQRGEISRMAARLKLHAEFEKAGMKVLAPQKVYTGASRGRNSLLGRRPRRRF